MAATVTVAGLAGIVLAVFVVALTAAPPPPFGPMSPAYAVVALLPAAGALAVTGRPVSALVAAGSAVVAAVVALAVGTPVWLVLDFLDCWLSWLADC